MAEPDNRRLPDWWTPFHSLFGLPRTNQAIKAGVHPRTLYALRDAGVLECLSRGVHMPSR